jgi:hypothetical protein
LSMNVETSNRTKTDASDSDMFREFRECKGDDV